MKGVGTRLRTTLGDAWLANLLLLTLESDLTKTFDKDAVIEAFNTMAHHVPPQNLRTGSAPDTISNCWLHSVKFTKIGFTL
ncbi:unnamed protein product [Phytophthora fragariaefolia]|uniref:Unnamed protein product n=1 Tax=Phytophthora fragariaefolia TaxID=1490495 RepID=A0A9W6XF84_9STRA|nr:unnamed protein product [Phytophthora fragariaefolia]